MFCGCFINESKDMEPLKTVSKVEIERFMGDWYVIANIPTFLEKNATNAIESYRLDAKGNIDVTFSFYQNSSAGKKKVYRPKGFIYNSTTNAEWRMQFLWPFKVPFLIIDLDDKYSYTVIGYPSRNYVWIMARKPELPEKTYQSILKNLEYVGYDISRIYKVPQAW
jgi:apolipoprotein D and lipocalin family protein